MGALWRLIEEYQDAQTYRPSVNQVAVRAGLGRSTLNRWQEINQLPKREHLEAVARVIGRPYSVVLDAALRDIGYLSEREVTSNGAPMTTKPNLLVSEGEGGTVIDSTPRTPRTTRTQRVQKSTKRNPSG